MHLHTAFVFCISRKTDDELEAIMATQPWAPALTYGFRNTTPPYALEPEGWGWGTPESIYSENGFGFSHDKWLDKEFNEPSPNYRQLPETIDDPRWQKRWDAQTAWWQATIKLVLSEISPETHCYRIWYGQIEDEFEPGQAEQSWKDAILERYNYDTKIIAEFEAT
jgi:hypothetical protein